ncbi:hypothetical protein NIES593_09950 [Hydrococcus rivularis NIES-593]|uniref:Uncharacterized protein n=1 Tax=Hydrococcus rivularis NIES-593 TaxID=1921803 RepID=A0A1U7HIW8_9CYAN|nr:hypothetical protein NIES593_09950 [Hydrococcus rivularis NIES-593]
MSYIIRPVLPEIREPQEIDEAEYRKIINARKLAWDILLVKEFFSYIVRNFLILESEINKIEIEAKADFDKFREQCRNGSFHLENTHIFNLLVMNLLTTCRSYLDLFDYQEKNKERELFLEEEEIRKTLKQIKEKYHDRYIVCSLFWELRNYAQHHSHPITGSPTNINTTEVKIEFTVNAEKVFEQLIAKQIKRTGKSSILQDLKIYLQEQLNYYPERELQKYPKYLNIRQLIKEYIVLLEKVNQEVNEKLNSRFQEAKTTLSQKVEYYCHGSSPESAFEIYKQNQENGNLERLDVSLNLFNNWDKVIKKYSGLDFINDLI